jgi:hypothetical protein
MPHAQNIKSPICSVVYLPGGFNLPLWKMMEFISWDDDIPNIWKKIMFQTTNQLCLGQGFGNF